MVRKDLGMVTAYAYAVSKGYTGTEAEFAELMASYASVAQEAVDAALAAAQSAQAAASARDTAQTTVAGAIAGIQAEGQTQVDNVNAAGATQIAAVEAKGRETRESIPDDYTTLANTVNSHSDEIANKYDRYKVETRSGLSADMFSIFPSEYSIVDYNNSDGLKHTALSGVTYLILTFKPDYNDFTCKLHYGAFSTNPPVKIILAYKEGVGAISLSLNATSGNVSLCTSSGFTMLSGISRNTNCRNIKADDELRLVRTGTNVAIYLVENGLETPVFADEFADIITRYGSNGFTAENMCFGLCTSNSARNEVLLYDFATDVATGDHFMAYDEADSRLSALENGAGFNPNKVDLFMFMGQSNMAGRGNGSQAPSVIAQAGYEFRAITDATKLYPIVEPFGVNENVDGKINDLLGGQNAKSGDMVPAFVNAYFSQTHVSIVGVSASEGGTRISLWQPDTPRYTDALSRFTTALNWLENNGYTVRHKYILWCQGESNGDDGMPKADYISAFTTMANAWFANGIEKIFIVKIGNYNGTGTADYTSIMDAQNEICQTMQNVVMASTDFAGMKARGLMKDDFHYTQTAYNEVGTYAGENVAYYVNTAKEPTMYDTQKNNLYFTHKN